MRRALGVAAFIYPPLRTFAEGLGFLADLALQRHIIVDLVCRDCEVRVFVDFEKTELTIEMNTTGGSFRLCGKQPVLR